MCQLRALLAGQSKFDPFQLAFFYGTIIKKPFLMGWTTRYGLGPLQECLENPDPNLAWEAAKEGHGAQSLSNGSLMRMTPMAVFCRNLLPGELQKCVYADCAMVHSNPTMLRICKSYCLAIQALLRNIDKPNRAALALQAVEADASQADDAANA